LQLLYRVQSLRRHYHLVTLRCAALAIWFLCSLFVEAASHEEKARIRTPTSKRMAESMYQNEESSQLSLSRHQCPRPLMLDIFQIKYTTGSNLTKQFMFPNDLADQVDKLRNQMKSHPRCRAVLIARICSLENEVGNYEDAGYPTFLSNVFQLLVCE
jgi:hypothetical protein